MKVQEKALTIIEKAKGVMVTDSESYEAAGHLWKAVHQMKKEVSDSFDPIITKAHQAHKEAIAQRDKILKPLDGAGRSIKSAMAVWDAEQERKRREEEARLREIARKEEEDRRLMEAIEAEESGDADEAAAILEEPIEAPAIVVPKHIPKVSGGPVLRTVWKFRIKDPGKIPREYMMPDSVKIGQVVRALKDQAKIDGIEVYQERV